MLTAEQKKVFEDLLEDDNFIGKKSLTHLLWLNTTKPKYKIGDCFLVTEPHHRVYGHPVKDFRGKITKITTYIHTEEYYYTFEGVVRCGDKETTVTYHSPESELKVRCEGNITIADEPLSEAADAIDVAINL